MGKIISRQAVLSSSPSSSSPPTASSAASQTSAAVISVPGPTSSPEALWLPFIHNIYPDRLQNTYFLPPLYFNRTFYTVGHFAGEEVVVMQQQQQQQQLKGQHHRRYGRSPAPSTVPQVAGRVFTPNPSGLQPSRHQDSDVQDDQAQQSTLQCLRALSDSLQQAMVVVSQLSFRKYLDNLTDPLELAAAASLPSSQHLSKRLRDGECDVLVIHRQQGIVVGEIKSVGGSAHFNSQPESQQNRMIVSKVEAALGQLNNQETVLRQLVSDLDVHVTKILILPNVTSAQLLRALANTPLAQTVIQCVGGASLQEAADRCLCKDVWPVAALPALTAWWQRTVLAGGPDPNMADEVYDRLLARFCGPATTIEVTTPCPPRKVVRTEGQAVAETGLRLSSLALTPQQVSILSSPDHVNGSGFVYLHAPPGCGKTVLLFLKAKQWLNQGHDVHVLSTSVGACAVSSLLAAQLGQTQGATAAVTTHMFDFANHASDVTAALRTLVSLSVLGIGVHVIVDEADCVGPHTSVDVSTQPHPTLVCGRRGSHAFTLRLPVSVWRCP